MKDFFKDILTDNTTRYGMLFSFIIILISAIFVFINYQNLPPFLPIFNQLAWGENRLGTTIQIFIPLTAVLIIFLLNLIIAPLFYKKIPLISRILAMVSLISSILVFLFLIRIIFSVI